MDCAEYHVVYVDNRVTQGLDGKLLQRSGSSRALGTNAHGEGSWDARNPDCLKSILGETEEVRTNLKSILSVFNGVHACTSGDTCMAQITQLESASNDLQPVLVMLGTPTEAEASSEPLSSLHSTEFYGHALLQHISTEVSNSSLSKLVVPVAMIYIPEPDIASAHSSIHTRPSRPSSGGLPVHTGSKTPSQRRELTRSVLADPQLTLRYVDIGAADVLTSPLQEDRLRCLTVHAYRAQKEALKERAKFLAQRRLRKRSWLGNTNNKPYAYLREAMVSGLMMGICNPDEVPENIDHKKLPVPDPKREADLAEAIGLWGFSGHDCSEDELIHAAFLMLQHALSMPELHKWQLAPVDLKTFLLASRAAYNEFVNYHNFRHVVDVMQAIFYFLLQLGTLPPYPASSALSKSDKRQSPIAALLKPFDALTLLITAIGHDVGHPGVNNAFLVALNAPLAQLYNDKSVLEAFHCAAYSQILRRYWKAAFEDTPMRGLMINSILATDMGMHFSYMKELGNLQDKVHHNNGTDGWSPQVLDEYRILACALLVKCADISNVARPFSIAAKWASILQLEFANQGVMETDVGIPTTLFGGPPELGNVIKLGNSQSSFMNIFARPLFEAVTDIMPAMGFAVNEMKMNQGIWTDRVRKETAKEELKGSKRHDSSEVLSPRSGSPSRSSSQPELSHPEGLPASKAVYQPLDNPLADASEEVRRASTSSGPFHHGLGDATNDSSRRSSHGLPLNQIGSSDLASYSRRSSGALSAANTPHSTVTTRQSNNTSPSQLQLGRSSETRSETGSTFATSENVQPIGRASEDTLSQRTFSNTSAPTEADRRASAESGGGGDSNRRGSKVNDTDNQTSKRFSGNGTASRPLPHSNHHRSSSGAHTNNTNISQSTPYSPTGTQATSVLTVDSDEKSSQGAVDSRSTADRKFMPDVVNVDRPGGWHRYGSLTELDRAKEADVKTSVTTSGSSRDGSLPRLVGRKSSRFNFNFWKRRAKGVEASP